MRSPKATPAKGKKVYKKNCRACHIVGGKGGKVGPELDTLMGRTAGALEGYKKFSKALVAAGKDGVEWSDGPLVWTDETFAIFLKNPKKAIKGTKMAKKLKKEKDIADFLAYLKSL